MRDKLIHAYDAVDLDEVWETITKEIAPLISFIEPLVPQEKIKWKKRTSRNCLFVSVLLATSFERLERFERLELSAVCYLNCGITRSANSRMFLSATSCGMPPNWKVPETTVSPASSRHL